GRSGAEVELPRVDLYLNGLCLLRKGCPEPLDSAQSRQLLTGAEVFVRVCLNLGGEEAVAWGCDLSEEYVRINSDYTT
ncbi:MAG: hypothetical protein DRI40_05215, partial [Chloroflexi bacterium]